MITANCSDPRDRLAALYGFLPQSEQPIDLQYSQIGWKEMYRRLFAFGPVVRRSLDDSDYPSWVPDWFGVRQLGMASGEFPMDGQHSTDRADKPWIDCPNEIGASETEGPSSKPHLNDSLSRREKEKLWLPTIGTEIAAVVDVTGAELEVEGGMADAMAQFTAQFTLGSAALRAAKAAWFLPDQSLRNLSAAAGYDFGDGAGQLELEVGAELVMLGRRRVLVGASLDGRGSLDGSRTA
ncbi:hypothetical protein LZ30DRAFT_731197 [Colletotrichum cereale]|nr:hypothetical protein LZ30DRAFT_731197 [Colletotrichum cereale]